MPHYFPHANEIGAFGPAFLRLMFAYVMRDLFGVSLVPATIARMSRCCADRLQSFIDTVREEVCRAKVKHLDETGFRLFRRATVARSSLRSQRLFAIQPM